jgi:predicted NUDIX family NTP pyrophosphohydrolase
MSRTRILAAARREFEEETGFHATSEVPEVDRGRWFSMSEAHKYFREEQRELLRRLSEIV